MATSKQINEYVKIYKAKKINALKIKEKCPKLFAKSKVFENQLEAMKETILKGKNAKRDGFEQSVESTTNKLLIKTKAVKPQLRTTISINPKEK
mgnify:FL=1